MKAEAPQFKHYGYSIGSKRERRLTRVFWGNGRFAVSTRNNKLTQKVVSIR